MSKREKEKFKWNLKVWREKNRHQFLINMRILILGGITIVVVYLLQYLQLHSGIQ